MKRRRILGYTYGWRKLDDGREVKVYTAKPRMKGAKKCYGYISPLEKALDDLWKYWEGK